MNKRPAQLFFGAAALAAAACGVNVCATWLTYGGLRRAGTEEADPLLDRFMSEYEVEERHHLDVDAPAEVTFAAACDMDFADSRIVRTVFKARELLLRARPARE